jgi:hypothetical protein
LEEKLEAEKNMVPFEGLMLTKLIESRDPKFKSFSREYDKDVLVVSERQTCAEVNRKLS